MIKIDILVHNFTDLLLFNLKYQFQPQIHKKNHVKCWCEYKKYHARFASTYSKLKNSWWMKGLKQMIPTPNYPTTPPPPLKIKWLSSYSLSSLSHPRHPLHKLPSLPPPTTVYSSPVQWENTLARHLVMVYKDFDPACFLGCIWCSFVIEDLVRTSQGNKF